jgi:hypothetical protein
MSQNIKPGDPFYEEYRFELNEYMERLTRRELIFIINDLIDKVDDVQGYEPDDAELQEITGNGEE